MRSQGRYRKLFLRLWRSAAFVALNTREKLIAIYVLAGPQTNRIGLYRLSQATGAEDLGEDIETFSEGFKNVCSAFGWEFDPIARVVWIPSWWRFNIPENPNVLKGAIGDLAEVPDTALIRMFIQHIETLPEYLHSTFLECLVNVHETLREPSTNQEHDQEPKQEREQERESALARPTRNSRSRLRGHTKHPFCGDRVCLTEYQLEQFSRRLSCATSSIEEARTQVCEWAKDIDQRLTSGEWANVLLGEKNDLRFWDDRWEEFVYSRTRRGAA